mmetsp:Transcript_10400/g.10026  ORF Transcript_10400/g.10026 Transcript_10400/m.10026 type:complete len:297 (-) Transcript_10400:64-954(-)|eukprot:CAMPEP_0119033174 /NCGR_PEP_ID=MMETSP1177-20130426/181_1 /TAXON_ID=2985 /ORGANISM="Ochromonas sp, Strain CCMP1899" /LENGTH=296 /DNA_ID=CAMNT_0006989705 /DNA_START=108 /DNA_END=998 /DNA_ORIENTATION=+
MARLLVSLTIVCIFSFSNSFKFLQPIGLRSNQICSPKTVGYFRSSVRLQADKEDENFIPPPPPNSKGEWSDWDTESYVEEPYEEDKEETLQGAEDKEVTLQGAEAAISENPISSGQWSPLNTGNKKEGEPQGMSASDNWAGWSEEPPYFDEDDVEDDEGNWGRASEDKPGFGAVSGSSDLWTRQTPDVQIPTTPAAQMPSTSTPTQTVAAVSTSAPVQQSGADTLTVVLEMNRQFAALDTKTTSSQSISENKATITEKKVDVLVTEVGELRRLLTFTLGALAVLTLKTLLKPSIFF